jgi:quercetin dioxygenase-like cupin family protein
MTEAQAIRLLQHEGFLSVYAGHEAPDAEIPEHGHDATSTVIVLAGEMTILEGGTPRRYGPGDRYEVRAGEVHSAKVGASGCHYVVGE